VAASGRDPSPGFRNSRDSSAELRIHIAGQDRESFLADVTTRAAVLHELTVIGEGASRLTEEFRIRHPEVPWAKIVAFRNFIVHEYFGLEAAALP